MRALIIDDEDLARAVVREHLAAHPDVEVAGECANGFEALKAVALHQPDLIFLDIQMPGLSGLDVLHARRITACTVPVYASSTASRRPTQDSVPGGRSRVAARGRTSGCPVSPDRCRGTST